jgi:DNA replication protein DnaC
MSIQPELKTVLRRLKLSGMLAILPDRVAYACAEKLDYAQFLELVLSDEVERRDQKHVTNRLIAADFEEECTLERFDWSAKIQIDKARLTDLFGLHFIERRENVILCGPVGVGKSFLARACISNSSRTLLDFTSRAPAFELTFRECYRKSSKIE